jgi:hypothetical protein
MTNRPIIATTRRRALNFDPYGRAEPAATAVRIAVPGCLLTRKGHRFKPCRAHQAQRIYGSAAQRRVSADHFL